MMDPYITLSSFNFVSHINVSHPEMDRWKIIATICEPDLVCRISGSSEQKGKFYFIERDIEGRTARVVVNRNRQGILYVVTAYIVESNPEKESKTKDRVDRIILYSNLV